MPNPFAPLAGLGSGSITLTLGVGLASTASAIATGCSEVDVDEREAAGRLTGASMGEVSDRVWSIELAVLLVMYVSCEPSRLALLSARGWVRKDF